VLARLLREIRAGETLVVVRLARSVGHLLAVIERASGVYGYTCALEIWCVA